MWHDQIILIVKETPYMDNNNNNELHTHQGMDWRLMQKKSI